MKTEIDIPDDLAQRAQWLAERQNMDMGSLTQEALRRYVEASSIPEGTCHPASSCAEATGFVTDGGYGPRSDLPDDFIAKIRHWAYENES